MVVFEIIHVIVLWTIFIGTKGNEVCDKLSPCVIRFYAKQYFKGNYWTLDSRNNWTASKQTRLNVPYRHFHAKSVRSFCSSSCNWEICRMRSRKYSNLSRRKRCKIIAGDKSLESLTILGWSNYILGSVRKVPNKENITIPTTTPKHFFNTKNYSTTATITTQVLVINDKAENETFWTKNGTNDENKKTETSTTNSVSRMLEGMN